MLTHNLDPLAPTLTSCLLYIQCLANSYKTPRTVRNYLSGARTYVIRYGGDPASFSSPLIGTVLRGVTRLAAHEERPAPPLSRATLLALCDDLAAAGPDGAVARAAVLFGVATLLRQSNFLPSAGSAGGPHLARRGDVDIRSDALLVRVWSSKTLKTPADAVTLRVLAAPGSPYCPVAAMRGAWRLVPAPAEAPLFLFPSTGRPLTAPALVSVMRAALGRLRCPVAHLVTVHSLRRTGAHLASAQGATDADVMSLGTWTSSAVRRYLPREVVSSAPAALAACLASGR